MGSIDLQFAVIQYACLLFALSVHEASHAAMALHCGDDTAKHLGRITLNPIAHIDLFGTVLMPILMITTGFPFLFGWAKPVPFNPRRLKDFRRDPVKIAVAGPLSNLALALVFILVGRLFMTYMGDEAAGDLFWRFFAMMVVLNLVLLFFNFIPVPPLDGHYVLNYFLPPQGQRVMASIGPFGIIIALLLSRPLFSAVDPIIIEALAFMLRGDAD